ncbi:MAG: DNA mismatch repair endonuclease MutL [Deltaproteobacteria bacterium]|nr:DNA mismatch repair endonuclease MutL [Deltaproteobacteria bacterium]
MPNRKIHILDPTLASKIAAGEVVDRPASAVKELIENSIDAGATAISVYITEGGKRLIRVVDNGEGISKEDAPLAFYRHATSKISKEEDLDRISTMGFRGEALASIAAVAKVVLKTRRPGEIAGTCVTIDGGSPPEVSDDGCPEGTSIEVKDLFYNTPARLKFLRSPESEFARIADIFKTLALANPSIRFRLVHGSSRPVEAPPGTLKERIADLFGADVAKKVVEVRGPHINGYIGSHELSYPNSKALHTFVNGRAVRDKAVNHAIIEGYGAIIDGRYPFAALDLKTPPEDVDVNIHPTKSEVRFKNPRFVYDTVKAAVRGAFASGPLPGKIDRADSNGPFARRGFAPSPFQPSQRAAEINAGYAVRTGPLVFDEGLKEAKNPELASLEPVGQLWGEFLVAQGEDFFYIIDQHGAAERIAFERLKERYYGGGVRGQMLLIPERVETTPEERDYLTATLDSLGRLGFEVEDFGPSPSLGGQTFMIKSVPDILSSRDASALIKAVSKDLSGAGTVGAEESIEEALMRIACHSVIRGQRTLTREEARALLKSLADVDFAGHCPHGRPVVKRLSKEEVEEMFKR